MVALWEADVQPSAFELLPNRSFKTVAYEWLSLV
jgi:hypothetical protein